MASEVFNDLMDPETLRGMGFTEQQIAAAREPLARLGRFAVEEPQAAIKQVVDAFQRTASEMADESITGSEALSHLLDHLGMLGHAPGNNPPIDGFMSKVTAALKGLPSVSMAELANILKRLS